MKHILLFFTFIFTLGATFAQENSSDGSKIYFKANNITIDYGVVKKG